MTDAADLMDVARHDLKLSKTQSRFPTKDTCLAIYSFVINSSAPIDTALKEKFPWCVEWRDELRKLFGAYVGAKQRQNVLDYDDLLLYWSQMMGDEALAAEIGERFDHVLVDEYQDTNGCKPTILLKLKPEGAASPWSATTRSRSIRFAPRRCATSSISRNSSRRRRAIVTLEENYRSTQPILDACNARDRAGDGALHQESLRATADPSSGRSRHRARRSAQADYVAERILEPARRASRSSRRRSCSAPSTTARSSRSSSRAATSRS